MQNSKTKTKQKNPLHQNCKKKIWTIISLYAEPLGEVMAGTDEATFPKCIDSCLDFRPGVAN